MVELRELHCLVVLAEERHFGRTAARLHLSQPRVSQIVRRLESVIGAPLFERTSRRVELTPLGRSFLEQVQPLYDGLVVAVADARATARGLEGTLRVGFLGAGANELTRPVLRTFSDRHPTCLVEMVEVDFADQLGPLRAGEFDVLLARLPVREDDLIVGPVLVSEPRALAVPSDHPFAARSSVSIEDIARDPVFDLPASAPAYWRDFHVPRATPSGRPLRRVQTVGTVQELLSLVAAGRGVSPMVASMPRFYARPDVRYVPVRDLPWSDVALVWRRAGETARVRAFAQAAADVVEEAGGPAGGPPDGPARR